MKYCLLVLALCCSQFIFSQQKAAPVFKVVPLGVYGGAHEGNLSSYMLAVNHTDDYVCLDAGTVHDGIEKAIKQRSLTGNATAVLKNNIKGYLISHPHLDHVSGLIINSPDDTAKNIYGLPFCLNTIQEKYFSWKSWANFGDEGEKPLLKKYHYMPLAEGTETPLANTKMFVQPFELSHSNPYKSTAFLVRCDSSYILYLGDTGADSIEKADNLSRLWRFMAPLIQHEQLKAIFIEVSFPDEQPKDKLFGHLTPQLLLSEMAQLATLCGKEKLAKLPVVITHIKPNGNNEMLIKKELEYQNNLPLKLVFPQQGNVLFF